MNETQIPAPEATEDHEQAKPLLNRLTDRCDRCGAEALVRATIEAGELLFCGHHANEHDDKLRAMNAVIEDTRDFVAPDPAPVNA